MAGFRLTQSLARAPRRYPQASKGAAIRSGKAAWPPRDKEAGRFGVSLYSDLRNALADDIDQVSASDGPPTPSFSPPEPLIRHSEPLTRARETPILPPPPTPDRLGRILDEKYSVAALYRIRGAKNSAPLRILFCGSDEFSCESLKALYAEWARDRRLIKSIDVVVRPAKPTGRGLKEMREVPLKKLAETLGLPIHERDTFTGWHMPQYSVGIHDAPSSGDINLIIAVSFGLFVPPRLLSAAKYGGLNVHPSLLPDFRGPAPLHHTLLSFPVHRRFTGVTLQTLSPVSFDAGAILAQTPRILFAGLDTVPRLAAALAHEGAQMLVAGLRYGVHVPPHRPITPAPVSGNPIHAPKITPADRQVMWSTTEMRQLAQKARVLGPMWTHVVVPEGKRKRRQKVEVKRLVLEGMRPVLEGMRPVKFPLKKMKKVGGEWRKVTFVERRGEEEVRTKAQYLAVEGTGAAYLRWELPGWRTMQVDRITVEGEKARDAAVALARFSEAISDEEKGREEVLAKALEEGAGVPEVPETKDRPQETHEPGAGGAGEEELEGLAEKREFEDEKGLLRTPETRDGPQETHGPGAAAQTPEESGRVEGDKP